jgi:hypothetical protein
MIVFPKLQHRLRRLWLSARSLYYRLRYVVETYGSPYYVTVDGTDNSVTFSPQLVRLICRDNYGEIAGATAFSFIERGSRDVYSFAINAPVTAQCAGVSAVQYNSRHHCVGFASLCPTVNRVLYDYDLHGRRAKLYVRRTRTWLADSGRHIIVYQYLRPWKP